MTASCMVVDGDSTHTEALSALSRNCGFSAYTVSTLEEAGEFLARQHADIVFVNLDLPGGGEGLALLDNTNLNGAEIIYMGDVDDPVRADEAIRRGAVYFFCKPFDECYLQELMRDIAAECAAESSCLVTEGTAPVVPDQFGFLRGSSRPMRRLYRQLRKVAPSDASLFVYGESGTGKELVARTVHTLSDRRDQPFVAFNCAAVAESLVESELFGHEKGSFSGAERQHRGYFEQADGGTLLLDEITELDVELQTKLLRVLESGAVRRLGSEEDIALDVRIVSATNRHPDEAVASGHLREDLYYRLAQFPVSLPPLRSRGSDVTGLAQHFLSELNALHETALYFSEETIACVAAYHWPGNVRQLRHAVERAYILCEQCIEPGAFELATPEGGVSQGETVAIAIGSTLAESEKEIILATLEQHDGDKTAAAMALGISVKTLYNKLNRYRD